MDRVDFYMACMQNTRRNREGEQSGFITGKTKQNLIFYPKDRPVLPETLKRVAKPVIAIKIFAGGQMFLAKRSRKNGKSSKAPMKRCSRRSSPTTLPPSVYSSGTAIRSARMPSCTRNGGTGVKEGVISRVFAKTD